MVTSKSWPLTLEGREILPTETAPQAIDVVDCDRALELEPDYAYLYAVRGGLYLKKGDVALAIQDFDKALDLDPCYADAYNDRGVAYGSRGEHTRAMQDYNKALSLGPNVFAFFNRGIGLLRLGKWEQAISNLRRASNMGMDIVEEFRTFYGSVAEFQDECNLRMPEEICKMLIVEEEAPADAGASVLAMFKKARESLPKDAFNDAPSDLARNYKHYLYGWAKSNEL